VETLEELQKQYLEATKRYMKKLERYQSLLSFKKRKEELTLPSLELIAELNKTEQEMIDAQYEKYEIHNKIRKLLHPD
jgi:thiaminase